MTERWIEVEIEGEREREADKGKNTSRLPCPLIALWGTRDYGNV